MKRLTIAVAIVVILVAAAPATAQVFTIRGDWKMGAFAVKRDGTLAGAIAAFGEPGSRNRSHEVCTVRWPRHRLKIAFYNLGGQNPCRPAFGFFSNARAKGSHWQTDRGLEIGDRQGRLRRLYPNATLHSGASGPLVGGSSAGGHRLASGIGIRAYSRRWRDDAWQRSKSDTRPAVISRLTP